VGPAAAFPSAGRPDCPPAGPHHIAPGSDGLRPSRDRVGVRSVPASRSDREIERPHWTPLECDTRNYLATVDEVIDGVIDWLSSHPSDDLDLQQKLARFFASQSLALTTVSQTLSRSRFVRQQSDCADEPMTESMWIAVSLLSFLRSLLPIDL
jgi:hypothetical protein